VGDDGYAISYKLLERGVPVVTSDGSEVGTVERVLENEREHIFDGIVVRSERGELFVDAPEVARIAERQVTLSIDAEEAAALPQYEPGPPEFQANPRAGKIGRFLGGGWKRRG
jgi:sporulation protein YlmC with PRC-barrel domain